MARSRRVSINVSIYLGLFLVTISVYAQVCRFDFVNFDDPDYVTSNWHLRQGFTPETLKWALTSGDAANWFPLTRLSHALDYQLFGSDPGAHHLVNLFWHVLATLFLFAFLHRATGARWRSALVATLFAIHPLHVESVAWVSERKDVLCAFFWFLALWSYVRYIERMSLSRYMLVVLCFCLGLMTKPMIVTLPFLLLLLDVWPLKRLQITPDTFHRKTTRLVLAEKFPLLTLSIVASLVTYLVQRNSGAVQGLTVFPLWLRLQNVLLSYIVYIFKFLWPAGLAVFYPYPASIAVWKATFAALAILAISALVLLSIRTRPYLAIGWFWYLGTLVPVIGLMQAGAQARADRYMYVPMVGLLIILVWGAEEFVKRRSISPRLQVAAVSAVCAALAVACVIQIRYWRNTETLFRHALDVTRRNYLAEHNLGSYLLRFPERQAEAAAHLEASLTLDPNNAGTHSDLGIALSNMPNRLPDAIAQYRIALHLNPNSAILHNNLGTALEKTGRMTEAIAQYEVALRIDPNYADVRKNLASALTQSRLRAARFQ